MVGALEETGAIDEVADGIAYVTGGDRTAELLGITWVSAIGSAIVDNIPFTAAMIPVVEQLQGDAGDDAYWWALALGACFGGNATIVAAAANVAAAGMAARAGRPIGFVDFLRIGIPVTLVSHRPRHRLHRREVPMSPSTLTDPLLREAPLLHADDTVGDAVRADARQRPARPPRRRRDERLVGIFGEREFIGAVFPGYLERAQVRRLRHAVARRRAREARRLPRRAGQRRR